MPTKPRLPPAPWPQGGGETGRLVRDKDWGATPLGPLDGWSQSLRSAVEIVLHSPVPIVMLWGPDGVMIYNDAYSVFAGDRHPQLFGSKVLEGWPEVADFNRRVMEVGLRGETLSFVDQPLLLARRGGAPEPAWLNLDYSPLFDDAGRPAGVFAIVVETTQRVLAERQKAALLAEAQSNVAALHQWFEQAPGFVALLRGREHVFELANKAYYQLIGHRPLVGRPLFEALPEIRHQGFEALLGDVYDTGVPFVGHSMPLSVQREPDGPLTEAFVDFVYEPLRDANGQVNGIFVQGHEVTDAVRAIEALKASEERFRLAVDSSSLGTFDFDLDSGVARLSPRGQELFDLRGDETTVAACFSRVHPDDAALVDETLRRARAGDDDGRYALHHRIVRPDGSVRWLDVAGRASRQHQRVGGGVNERLAGVLWDITEERALMATLREADRRKDEFLATLAHELRNPLAPIRTAAHLLSMPAIGLERLKFCSDLIQRQTRTMALLLDDLLDVSRITRGKLELKKNGVGIETIVDAALETARPLLDSKRHAIEVALPPEAPPIEADALRIAQVLTNLVTNAAKYTDPGGKLRLAVAIDGPEVRFEVSDTGVGIAPEALPTLFEMFQQVRGTLDRSQGGLGIGLALSRGLAELHGGRLEAFSAGIGHGATFRLTIPVGQADGAPQAGEPTAPRPGIAPTRQRIVVADDNIDAANSLAMVLEHDGYVVHVAHDGASAYELATRVRPAAAFLDIGMPGLDGYALARKLREQSWGRAMLLVATTGWGQDEDRKRAIECGFDEHLTKPVDPGEPLRMLAKRRAPPGAS